MSVVSAQCGHHRPDGLKVLAVYKARRCSPVEKEDFLLPESPLEEQ